MAQTAQSAVVISDATRKRYEEAIEGLTLVGTQIATFGRFEAEQRYVPYFWSFYLDGCADRDDGRTLGFDISAEERALFPELKGRRSLRLYQDDNGFIREV